MGLPRLGGQGGSGGDVWVVATKNVTLKRIKDTYPDKRIVGGAGANSRFVSTNTTSSFQVRISVDWSFTNHWHQLMIYVCRRVINMLIIDTKTCQPELFCVFSVRVNFSTVSEHWKERGGRTRRSSLLSVSLSPLMMAKYLVCQLSFVIPSTFCTMNSQHGQVKSVLFV